MTFIKIILMELDITGEKMVRQGDQSEGSGEWKRSVRMEVEWKEDLNLFEEWSQSKFGCQLNARNRGESGVKGVPEAVT